MICVLPVRRRSALNEAPQGGAGLGMMQMECKIKERPCVDDMSLC
jgi:hypothetical protein